MSYYARHIKQHHETKSLSVSMISKHIITRYEWIPPYSISSNCFAPEQTHCKFLQSSLNSFTLLTIVWTSGIKYNPKCLRAMGQLTHQLTHWALSNGFSQDGHIQSIPGLSYLQYPSVFEGNFFSVDPVKVMKASHSRTSFDSSSKALWFWIQMLLTFATCAKKNAEIPLR